MTRSLVFLLVLLASAAAAQTVTNEGCGIAAGGNARDNIVNCYGVPEEKVDEVLALLVAIQDQSRTAAARELKITQKAIIFLAQHIAEETETFDQALAELENAVDVAIDVQRRGSAPSNAGPFVDQVLAEVAALSRNGDHTAASNAVDQALARLDVAEDAIKNARIELLTAGISEDILRRDAVSAARRVVDKTLLEEPDPAQQFAALRTAQNTWYLRGRDKGVNLDLIVAIEIAGLVVDTADTAYENGAALTDLGIALATLGERDSNTARLELAVEAFEATLNQWTRDRVPLDWAMTQNNLGNAHQNLGERKGDTVQLEQAVAAYEKALLEWTRDRVPLDWAMTQNNLGMAFQSLGEREGDTARLEQAVTAYEAALQERTRGRVPLDWATTQNALGNALQTLGQRESDLARLEQAVVAYRGALQEWTRDRVPLDWAMTQNNLGNALAILGMRESDTARLEQAVEAFELALLERTRDRVPLNWATTQNNLGNALQILGWRKSDMARLEQAVAAFEAALLERTRDRVPLDWAIVQENMSLAEGEIYARTKDPATLERARQRLSEALEIYESAGATFYADKAKDNLAWLEDLALR